MSHREPPIHTHDREGRPYLRVALKSGRHIWAVKLFERPGLGAPCVRGYRVLAREGGSPDKPEIILCAPEDVEQERPAQMNCKYGWFEVIE